jgi:hypothetical protein
MRTLLCRSSLLSYQSLVQESVQARLSKCPNPSLFSCNFSPITSQGLGMVVEDRVWPTNVSMVCVISILELAMLAYENQVHILRQSLNQIRVGVPVSIKW